MGAPAVLLMAYGAADTLDEIPAYLADILSPRPVPPALSEQVRARYAKIGGSPLKKITARQAAALQQALGDKAKVYVGMRHSAPWIRDAAAEIVAAGHDEIVAFPLTPFHSQLSVGAYLARLKQALPANGPALRAVGAWHKDPGLIAAYAARIKEALADVPQAQRGRLKLLLTAHSLPERIVQDGDPYPDQLKETARLTAAAAGFAEFAFAYQSAGGGGREPWLGPDAAAAIKRLAAGGAEGVLLSPLGFVCEHMETLYDCDILFRETAAGLGLGFYRARTVDDHPDFIQALTRAALAAPVIS